jgi:acetolactate synthase-1/2/3 large subunit
MQPVAIEADPDAIAQAVKAIKAAKNPLITVGAGALHAGEEVQELATAVQHGINLVTIVFNNQGYGNVRRDQNTLYEGRLIGADLTNPDFVKLAESFGAIGYRATSAAELKPILEKAFKDDAPVIIEIIVEPGSEVSPWSFINPEAPQ